MRKLPTRQANKRILREEIRESENEQRELTEEEAAYIAEYNAEMGNDYDYELDWQEELAEDSEIFDARDFADPLEWDYFDNEDPYPLYDGDGWLDFDE